MLISNKNKNINHNVSDESYVALSNSETIDTYVNSPKHVNAINAHRSLYPDKISVNGNNYAISDYNKILNNTDNCITSHDQTKSSIKFNISSTAHNTFDVHNPMFNSYKNLLKKGAGISSKSIMPVTSNDQFDQIDQKNETSASHRTESAYSGWLSSPSACEMDKNLNYNKITTQNHPVSILKTTQNINHKHKISKKNPSYFTNNIKFNDKIKYRYDCDEHVAYIDNILDQFSKSDIYKSISTDKLKNNSVKDKLVEYDSVQNNVTQNKFISRLDHNQNNVTQNNIIQNDNQNNLIQNNLIQNNLTQNDNQNVLTQNDNQNVLTQNDNQNNITQNLTQNDNQNNVTQNDNQNNITQNLTQNDNQNILTQNDNQNILTQNDNQNILTQNDNQNILTQNDNQNNITHNGKRDNLLMCLYLLSNFNYNKYILCSFIFTQNINNCEKDFINKGSDSILLLAQKINTVRFNDNDLDQLIKKYQTYLHNKITNLYPHLCANNIFPSLNTNNIYFFNPILLKEFNINYVDRSSSNKLQQLKLDIADTNSITFSDLINNDPSKDNNNSDFDTNSNTDMSDLNDSNDLNDSSYKLSTNSTNGSNNSNDSSDIIEKINNIRNHTNNHNSINANNNSDNLHGKNCEKSEYNEINNVSNDITISLPKLNFEYCIKKQQDITNDKLMAHVMFDYPECQQDHNILLNEFNKNILQIENSESHCKRDEVISLNCLRQNKQTKYHLPLNHCSKQSTFFSPCTAASESNHAILKKKTYANDIKIEKEKTKRTIKRENTKQIELLIKILEQKLLSNKSDVSNLLNKIYKLIN
jgi:hypothetical protein